MLFFNSSALRYSEESDRSANAFEKRADVMGSESADMASLKSRSTQGSKSSRAERERERRERDEVVEIEMYEMREMTVDQIWKEEGGVLSWMTDNSGAEYGYGGSSWGWKKATSWLRSMKSSNRVGS